MFMREEVGVMMSADMRRSGSIWGMLERSGLSVDEPGEVEELPLDAPRSLAALYARAVLELPWVESEDDIDAACNAIALGWPRLEVGTPRYVAAVWACLLEQGKP